MLLGSITIINNNSKRRLYHPVDNISFKELECGFPCLADNDRFAFHIVINNNKNPQCHSALRIIHLLVLMFTRLTDT